MSFSVSATVKSYPRLPYQKMKEDILGKGYELSLVFVGKKRAATLNRAHRNKDYVPNVLSFPIDTNIGEIFITPEVAKKESAAFGMTPNGYIGYLFIHGLLHLKGHTHGSAMEKAEARYTSRYNLK